MEVARAAIVVTKFLRIMHLLSRPPGDNVFAWLRGFQNSAWVARFLLNTLDVGAMQARVV
jgi:hypothetical protein